MAHYNIKINALGETKFTPEIVLKKDVNYEIGLRHGVISKNWHNISTELGNNQFTYNSTVYTLEDGNYDVSSLQTEIQRLTASSIILSPVYHVGKVLLVNNTANPFITGSISSVLGFNTSTTIPPNSSVRADKKPDFSAGHHELELWCDLVDSRTISHVGGRRSHMLKAVVDNASPHSHIRLVEHETHYLPMKHIHSIYSVVLTLRNHNGDVVKYNENDRAEFFISIREIK